MTAIGRRPPRPRLARAGGWASRASSLGFATPIALCLWRCRNRSRPCDVGGFGLPESTVGQEANEVGTLRTAPCASRLDAPDECLKLLVRGQRQFALDESLLRDGSGRVARPGPPSRWPYPKSSAMCRWFGYENRRPPPAPHGGEFRGLVATPESIDSALRSPPGQPPQIGHHATIPGGNLSGIPSPALPF